MKLNLGCGDQILEGFVNCDLYDTNADVICDIKELPFSDNSANIIYSSHTIEHFHYYDAKIVLTEWYRVLKPGGNIHIETPDLLNLCKKFIVSNEATKFDLYTQFFGVPWVDGQLHKFLFTEQQLGNLLISCRYKDVRRVRAIRYLDIEDICLGMEATK